MTDSEMKLSDLFHSLIPDEYRNQHGEVKPMTEAEFAHKQCEWYNESEGQLGGVDCPDCKNRGNYQILDDDGNRVMRECHCMAQRRYIQMMQNAGLGDLYKKCTFDSYITDTDWRIRCKQSALQYANRDGNGWFLFAGQSGTGKTHLCTAICSELAKRGRGIRYIQWKRLFDKLVQTKFKEYEQEYIFRESTDADVLYLDDFLKTPANIPPTPEMLSYALEIIDARYKADKKTIISTEFMLDEIIRFDEALGGRMREKTSKCMVKRETGRNFRIKEVKEL